MKKIGYNLARLWIRISLHLYFGKIKVSGLENVPKNSAVLFLPNHQNALLDVLLIGVDCNRKPWFLTRSDVFKKKILQVIFEYFQMIPVYRIRDGRQSLKNNEAVFDRCSDLLCNNESVLMFPEANHNLRRKVRPLSKGFTRILFNALEKAPNSDIQIVPVGLNYKKAVNFPDKVAVCFGKPISVQELYVPENERHSVDQMKKAVSEALKILTTHIEDEVSYDATVHKLESAGIDFLNPKEANAQLKNLDAIEATLVKKSKSRESKIMKAFFIVLNLPLLLIWRKMVKPKVPESEFLGTFRFAFALVVYPIYYLLLLLIVSFVFNFLAGLATVIGLFAFNWVYVKRS